MSEVSNVLLRLQKQHQLTLSQMATKADLAPLIIHRILTDENIDPKLSTLRKLAATFNITLSQLVGEEPLV